MTYLRQSLHLVCLFGSMAVLVASSNVHARIGETTDEVLAHYGEPLTTEIYRSPSGTEIMQEIHFDVEGVSVVVTMVDDVCVRVYYTQPEPFTDFVIKALMESNADGRRGKLTTYQSGSAVGLKTWTTIDKKGPEITGKVLSGTIEGNAIGGNLEVTTLDYVRAEGLLDMTSAPTLPIGQQVP